MAKNQTPDQQQPHTQEEASHLVIDEQTQHQNVLLSAEHNLKTVIDQIGSLGSVQYKNVATKLEDALHELQLVLKKV